MKLDAIEKFPLNDRHILHYGSINLISQLPGIGRLHELNLYLQDYLFYQLAPNSYSGRGMGEVEGESTELMFEPAPLLDSITRIIKAADSIKECFRGTSIEWVIQEIEEHNELETLLELKSLLAEAVEKNGIIGFTIA